MKFLLGLLIHGWKRLYLDFKSIFATKKSTNPPKKASRRASRVWVRNEFDARKRTYLYVKDCGKRGIPVDEKKVKHFSKWTPKQVREYEEL